MRLEYQILAAVALDLVLGDPRWFPHPVKGIYRLALGLEWVTRRLIPWARLAGIVTALAVYAVAGLAAWGLVHLAGLAHPWAADAVSIMLIYTAVAARDMARHSMAVFRPLVAGNLAEARQNVSMVVGRDTRDLDEAGVARAAVESVAESTVDGVTAPIFFAVLGGPVGAVVYRAINTLDSIFGHKNERYLKFGWAPARIDDLANFIPARVTAPLVGAAALLLRQRPLQSLRILMRDGGKHESPNAGLAEAAMAGALGVQLGGRNFYDGEPLDVPVMGDPEAPLCARHIPQANAMMFATMALFLALCLATRVFTVHLWTLWRAAT